MEEEYEQRITELQSDLSGINYNLLRYNFNRLLSSNETKYSA